MLGGGRREAALGDVEGREGGGLGAEAGDGRGGDAALGDLRWCWSGRAGGAVQGWVEGDEAAGGGFFGGGRGRGRVEGGRSGGVRYVWVRGHFVAVVWVWEGLAGFGGRG